MKRIMMILVSIFLLSTAGCTYRTCPTYTNSKIKKTQKQHVEVQDTTNETQVSI